MFRVDVLGPTRVTLDGVVLGDVRPASRALLTRLALAGGRSVSTEQLIDDLWDVELPAHPTSALRIAVSRTRKSLGLDARLAWENGGYHLDGASVDAFEFDALVARARTALAEGDADRAASAFGDALALWRGEALADVREAPFATVHAVRLESERLAVLEQRIAADLTCGRHTQLIAELEGLVETHPFQERFWEHRMTALYRAGRQADALRAYATVRELLADRLGLEPGPGLRALEQLVLAQSPQLDHIGPSPDGPSLAAAAPAPTITAQTDLAHADLARADVVPSGAAQGGLPAPLSGLVGRRDELRDLSIAVRRHRLVSLVGPAGVGKTRLSIEVARAFQSEQAAHVWVVDLAALTTPDSVHDAIGRAVAGAQGSPVGPVGSMAVQLAEHRGLLLLDNCEQLRTDVAIVADELLRALPGLTILATSRIPLGVDTEQIFRLDPLPLDDAVALFAVRSSATGDATGQAMREAMVAICAAVDGLPLAVELAAGLTRTLTVSQIAARIADRFRLLTMSRPGAAPHHRTLRAALEWGHDLLGIDERRLYRRLAVFAGGCSLEAIEEVCPDADLDAGSTAPCLARLVDASLVAVVDGPGGHRFTMLDTMHHFATERLAESGESDHFRERHLAWAATLADRFEESEAGDATQLDHEFANIRFALRSSLGTGRIGAAAELLLRIERVWLMQGHLGDARRLLNAIADDETLPAGVRGALYSHAGNHCLHAGRFDDAEQALDRGLPLARDGGDDLVIAQNLYFRGILDLLRARIRRAGEAFTEVLAIMRRIDRRSGIGAALDCLATVADLGGDHASAVRHRDEAESLDRDLGEPERLATGLARRAIGAVFAGELAEAQRAADEAVEIARTAGSPMLTGWAMEAAGRAATASGDVETARRAHAVALAAYAEMGTGHDVGAIHLDLAAGAYDIGEPATCARELATGLPDLLEGGADTFVADGLDTAAALLATTGDGRAAATVAATVAAFRGERGLVPSAAATRRHRAWTAEIGTEPGEPVGSLAAAVELALNHLHLTV